jgi:taurine dioxygenase
MSYRTMEVRPIAGSLGAEIYGANLKDRDDSPMWQALRQAFLEYRVIAIRGQALTPEDLMRVGGKFGEPCYYPFAKGIAGFPLITEVIKEKHEKDNFGEGWHTDTMYLEKPPRATLLYAIETPDRGGDTLYANTADAYDRLSEGMKKMIEGLVGVSSGGLKHRRPGARAAHLSGSGSMQLQNLDSSEAFESRHPIVRTHPDTGRRSLYLSALHTVRFDGFTEDESQPLIRYLSEHCTRPEFTCRVRWEPGQLTVWDNRTCLHNAINDYHGYRRRMQRLTVGPEVPVQAAERTARGVEASVASPRKGGLGGKP